MTNEEIIARLQEINDRLQEIVNLLGNPDENTDVDALETETSELIAERKKLMKNGEVRRRALAAIAEAEGVEVRRFNPFARGGSADRQGGDDRDDDDQGDDEVRSAASSPEYRRAFMKHLQGRELSGEEKRALSSGTSSAGAVIPTTTMNKVIEKMTKIVPLLDHITLLQIPGKITLAIEDGFEDASAHAENAEGTDAGDKVVSVSLDGYEVIKLIRISAKVSAMAINAFEDWLTNTLSRGVAYKIENWIANGTGTSEPKGFSKAQTWADGKNAVEFDADTPTFAEICDLISLLPDQFDPNAVFVMNKRTFWRKIMPIRDDSKAPIVTHDGGKYFILGYEWINSAKVADGEMYLGDMEMYYGNMSAPVEIAKSKESGFRHNAIDYRGTALFDGTPAVPEAFVKGSFAG